MRKLLIAIVCLIAAVAISGLVACGKKSDSGGITIDGFEDKVDTAELGEKYKISDIFFTGSDGNKYKATISVKDNDGNSVALANNQFTAKSMDGYIVTYTIKVGDKVLTRNVTLNIKDTGKPVVLITDPYMGFVGKEYTLPLVTATDLSGNIKRKTIKVYGPDNNEITVTDNKFTPSVRGEYKISATAEDSSGNISEPVETKIYVRGNISEGCVEDFDDEYSVNSVVNYQIKLTETQPEYKASFEGRSGVVNANLGNQTYPGVNLRFNMPIEELKKLEWAYIGIQIYIDTEGDFQIYQRNAHFLDQDGKPITISGKKWYQLRVTKALIEDTNGWFFDEKGNDTPLEYFYKSMTDMNGHPLFWLVKEGTADTRNVNVWIDKVTYVNYSDVTITNENGSLGQVITPTASVEGKTDLNYKFDVYNPAGDKVELDDNGTFIPNQTGKYKIKARIDDENLIGSAEEEVNITYSKHLDISEDSFTNICEGDKFVVPDIKMVDKDGIAVDTSTYTVGYTVSAYGEELIKDDDGKYTALYSGKIKIDLSGTVDGIDYIKTIYFNVKHDDSKVPEEGEINSFNDPTDIEHICIGETNGRDTGDVSWLPSYQGEKGVVKITYNQRGNMFEWPCLWLTAKQDMDNYKDYTEFVIKIFVANTSGAIDKLVLGDGKQGKDQILFETKNDNKRKLGEWVTYTVDATPFKEYFHSSFDPNDKAHSYDRLWMHSPKLAGEIYIADMYLTKPSDITVATDKNTYNFDTETNKSEDITVTITDIKNEGYDLKILNPDGINVNIGEGGKFVAEKEGRYTIRVYSKNRFRNGYAEVKILVGSLIINVDTIEDEFVAGDEVTVPVGELFDVKNNKKYEGLDVNVTVKTGSDVIEYQNGKFIAEKAGIYTITYTVDSDERVVEPVVTTITVKNKYPLIKGYLATFDQEEDITLSTNRLDRPNYKYHDDVWYNEFEGAHGVLRTDVGDSYYANYSYKFDLSQNELEALDFDYLIMRVYLHDKDSSIRTNYSGSQLSDGTCKIGNWYTIIMPKDLIFAENGNVVPNKKDGETDMQAFARLYSKESKTGNLLFWCSTPDFGAVYIDYIGYGKNYDVDLEAVGQKLGSETEIKAKVASVDDIHFTYKVIYNGMNGLEDISDTLTDNKFTATNPGKYTITATIKDKRICYVGSKVIDVNIYGDNDLFYDEYDESYEKGSQIKINEATFNKITFDDDGNEIKGEAQSGTIETYVKFEMNNELKEIDIVDGKIALDYAGTYTVYYKIVFNDITYWKVAEIIVNRDPIQEGEIESFDAPASIEHAGGNIDNKTWLESFEGENGVIKYSYTDNAWPFIRFVSRNDMKTLVDGGYTKFIIRMYIKDAPAKLKYLILGNVSGAPGVTADQMVYDKWYDYVIDAKGYYNYFKDLSSDKSRLWSESNSGEGEFYIDSIFLANDNIVNVSCDHADYSNTYYASGAGSECTISMSDINNSTSFETKCIDPDGNKVIINNNKFMVTKEGDYTVTVKSSVMSLYGCATLIVKGAKGNTLKATAIKNIYNVGDTVSIAAGEYISLSTMSKVNGYNVYRKVTVDYNDENGKTDKEIVLSDNKISDIRGGNYSITYTIKQGDDLIETIVRKFKVIDSSPSSKGYLLSFDDSDSLNSSTNAYWHSSACRGHYGEWFNSYKGANGVVSAYNGVVGGYKPFRYAFLSFENVETIKAIDFNYIIIRMYIPTTGKVHYSNGENEETVAATVEANTWTEVKFELSKMFFAGGYFAKYIKSDESQHDCFCRVMTGFDKSNNGCDLFCIPNIKSDTYIYIDYVKLVKE